MKPVKTVAAQSGHTMWVGKVGDLLILPQSIDVTKYTDFYVVRNFDEDGVTFFYMAKGYHDGDIKAPNQIHVWYPNGQMWSGFGKNFQEAINGAQRDGWMHTK